MQNKKYGLTPVRKCKQHQIQLLKKKFQEIKEQLEKNRSNKIYWINFFANGQYYCQTKEQQQEIQKFVLKTLIQAQNGVPQHVLSYGFTNSPFNNKYHQPYHIDYHPEYKNIFIPMTYLVYENSPQFLEHPLMSQPSVGSRGNLQQYGNSDIQMLERQGVDFLKISQVICKPFCILRLQKGTIHRGIINRTQTDRFMFHIGYSAQFMTLQNQKFAQDS